MYVDCVLRWKFNEIIYKRITSAFMSIWYKSITLCNKSVVVCLLFLPSGPTAVPAKRQRYTQCVAVCLPHTVNNKNSWINNDENGKKWKRKWFSISRSTKDDFERMNEYFRCGAKYAKMLSRKNVLKRNGEWDLRRAEQQEKTEAKRKMYRLIIY